MICSQSCRLLRTGLVTVTEDCITIFQAITDSPHSQISLGEIYQWFTTHFAYFRKNTVSWKVGIK